MLSLKAILIDDEVENLDVLEYELNKYCKNITIVDKCLSAKQGLIAVKKHRPDVIFLDINMPSITGLEMVEMLPDGEFDVIFTTAFEHYAVQAFKTCAVDYLLKPIDKDELVNAVTNISNRRNQSVTNRLDFLASQMKDLKNKNLQRVMLPSIDGIIFITLSEILYIESDQNYSNVFLENDKKVFIMRSLKFMQGILIDSDFIRVHKSYLINFKQIVKYVKSDGGHVVMKNEKRIPVSRTRKQDFAQLLSLS